jgi:hypothetical protein
VNKSWIKLFTSYGFVQSFTTQGIAGTEGLLVSTAIKLACKYTRDAALCMLQWHGPPDGK